MGQAMSVSWDTWRESYDEWGIGRQRRFYDEVFGVHRDQERFDVRRLGWLLDVIAGPVSVVELGGWDGGFARAMLAAHQDITSWENHEVSAAAVAGSVCDDVRYRAVALDDWYWQSAHTADVFVASHVLEHLRWDDVRRTFDATTCEWMFLQVPVGSGPTEWRGYHGSHILEVGWSTIIPELEGRGFVVLEGLSVPGAVSLVRAP